MQSDGGDDGRIKYYYYAGKAIDCVKIIGGSVGTGSRAGPTGRGGQYYSQRDGGDDGDLKHHYVGKVKTASRPPG